MTLIPLTAKIASSNNLLDHILRCTDYYIKLFINEIDEENLNFIEAGFSGYKEIKLNKEDWQNATTESGVSFANYKYSVSWSSTEVDDFLIAGYYVVDSFGSIIWYEKFSPYFVFSYGTGLNIIPRIALGSLPVPTPTSTRVLLPTRTPNIPLTTTPTLTPTVSFNSTPTPTPTLPDKELSPIGSFFKISTSLNDSLVVRIQDVSNISFARTAISREYQNVYFVGSVVESREEYNSPWNFHIAPESVTVITSDYPPNENFDLPPLEIQELIDQGFLSEGSEVCFSTLGVEEMTIKGIINCFSPLIWKTRRELDSETNEFIQFGYCEGDCENKISNEYCEGCVENIDFQTFEEWQSEFQIISDGIKERINNTEIDVNEIFLLSRSQREIELDEDIALIKEYLGTDSVIQEFLQNKEGPWE